MNKFKTNLPIFYLSFIILTTFFIEVIYYLPSPAGDSEHFLKLSFNICRYKTFMAFGSPLGDEWTYHGWIPSYLKSLLNMNCNYEFIFLFNFIVKLITIFFSYKLLKNKIKDEYLFILLIFIFIIQLKLQFRPENFALMLITIIYFLFENNKIKLVPVFFGFLFYTHVVFFSFLSLFFIISYYKFYFKLRIFLETILVFLLTILILDLIYPYSILNYITGNIQKNSATWLAGSLFNLKLFTEYYIITKVHGGGYLPLWGVLFFLITFMLLCKKKLFFMIIPFLYFFSLRNIPGNYYMVGLTPILIYIYLLEKNKNQIIKINFKKILFLLIILISILGHSHYLARNILTILNFKNDFIKTSNFIKKNNDLINKFPTFGFLINKNIRLQSYKINNCQNCNLSKTEKKYDLYSVNGIVNPCPKSNANQKDYSLKFMNKRVFNSNSGYGIYICNIE